MTWAADRWGLQTLRRPPRAIGTGASPQLVAGVIPRLARRSQYAVASERSMLEYPLRLVLVVFTRTSRAV